MDQSELARATLAKFMTAISELICECVSRLFRRTVSDFPDVVRARFQKMAPTQPVRALALSLEYANPREVTNAVHGAISYQDCPFTHPCSPKTQQPFLAVVVGPQRQCQFTLS